MVQNLLHSLTARVCGDLRRSRIGADLALVAATHCFFMLTCISNPPLATALLSCYMSPGANDIPGEGLSHSRNGVRGLTDLWLPLW